MHFTYEEVLDRGTLQQGDILKRTDVVDELLKTVHPHYYNRSEYRFLVVLTQSCDLDRRQGQGCKARYITLAAVRPFQTALMREVEKLRSSTAESEADIADVGRRQSIERFVERLLNNNEPSYFYLHQEMEAGLDSPHCAFLRLSVAVRSQDHYTKCLEAKILQLKPEFQAKLGWLAGNMYSRVGTPDWVPTVEGDSEFKKHIKEIVDQLAIWVPHKEYPKLVQALKNSKEPITHELVLAKIEELRPRPRKEQALERLRSLLPTVGLDPSKVEKAIAHMRNDPVLTAALRD